MLAIDITLDQLDYFSIIERSCSVFSLLGCVFIITTFCSSKSFHKPINRLVFYASFGNMMTNVATLMARSYVGDTLGAGCQFQAFLIQMFMPADAFWTLAMAVNVYLTFYYKFDARRLRKMEIPYLLVCYGIPFIIAMVYIFIKDQSGNRMYGNAVLWCWISSDWDIWRIATFYGPVWVTIFVTFFIYTRAGGEIYRKHKQLKELNYTSHYEPEPFMFDPFSVKTTEVSVTSEMVTTSDMNHGPRALPSAAYSVTISSDAKSAPETTKIDNVAATITPATAAQNSRRKRGATYEANNAAWAYAKCAILFFTAMLVTWIPSSANRVYSVVHVDDINLPLLYMSAFVLPLQGFWNAIVYMVTSWKACKNMWDDIAFYLTGGRPVVQEIVGNLSGSRSRHHNDVNNFQMMSIGRNIRNPSDKGSYETESMTELAQDIRPSSQSHEVPMV